MSLQLMPKETNHTVERLTTYQTLQICPGKLQTYSRLQTGTPIILFYKPVNSGKSHCTSIFVLAVIVCMLLNGNDVYCVTYVSHNLCFDGNYFDRSKTNKKISCDITLEFA